MEIKENKKYISYISVDESVNSFFKLLNVMNQNYIDDKWFSKNLDMFCLVRDKKTRELNNHAKFLNYESQRQIYNYVNSLFPEKLIEYGQYYFSLLSTDIFKTKKLYQGSIYINLYQFMHQNNLKQKDYQHLCNIAEECTRIVSGKEFMKFIGENIYQ